MQTFKIWDATFAYYSASVGGSTPKKLKWAQNIHDTEITFYTDLNLADHRIQDIRNSKARKKIAWLLEPQIIHPNPYHWIKDHYQLFDLVITHAKHLLDLDKRFIYCPFGGCWIPEQYHRWTGNRPGSVSLIASWKQMTPMHNMRHAVMRELGAKYGIEGYGEANNRHVKSKHEVLCNFKYSIVIENCATPGYFTEKLLDCIAAYCMPIYFGDPDVKQLFDVPTFTTMTELESILQNLPPIRPEVLEKNYNVGQQFFVPEDWIYDNVVSKI